MIARKSIFIGVASTVAATLFPLLITAPIGTPSVAVQASLPPLPPIGCEHILIIRMNSANSQYQRELSAAWNAFYTATDPLYEQIDQKKDQIATKKKQIINLLCFGDRSSSYYS